MDPGPLGNERAAGGVAPPAIDLEFVRRYGRQLILPEVGLPGQRRLHGSKALVVGLGGLGASAALHLAASGVGELHLLDPDRVELSNLHRQVLYTMADVGRPKAEAAAAHLLERNPGLKVRAEPVAFERAGAVDRVGAVDVVVDATDNFPTRYRVSDAAVRAGRPEVFASVHRLEGQVAVFDATNGPCYRCLFPEAPPADIAPGCGEAGVLGVVPAALGVLEAAEAIRTLLGWREPGATRLMLLDLRSMEARSVTLRKRPDCPGCAPGVARTPMPEEPTPPRLGGEDRFDYISPTALREELGRADPPTLIDVRDEPERALGSLPGSIWIPMDVLPDRLGELATAVRPVVFCQWGGRSERAGRLLSEAGLRPVRVLQGGLDAYAAEVDPRIPRW